MPPCKEKLYITDVRHLKDFPFPNIDVIEVSCIEGEGHDWKHQGQVWSDETNKVTGMKGALKSLMWE